MERKDIEQLGILKLKKREELLRGGECRELHLRCKCTVCLDVLV